tara:strand:- start:594 stop:1055 length:462 start_codon:yes stop_codon:yes gene_type:complete
MSHYPEDYERAILESTRKLEAETHVALSHAVAKALKYRTLEGLYDMKEALQERITDMKIGTKCDRNKPAYEPTPLPDHAVYSPNHYLKLGYECIEIIASSLSKEAFKGYCMGNFLKYRFRMGDKGAMQQDFDKSKEYLMLYDKYSHLCKDIPF